MDRSPGVSLLSRPGAPFLPAATADQILASRALPTLARSPGSVIPGTPSCGGRYAWDPASGADVLKPCRTHGC